METKFYTYGFCRNIIYNGKTMEKLTDQKLLNQGHIAGSGGGVCDSRPQSHEFEPPH